MKKYLLILVAFFTLTVAHGQTNIYHYFPGDTATWVVDHYSNGCTASFMRYCSSSYYEMNGDTIINGMLHKKIYTRDVYFYYITPPLIPNPGVVGANYSSRKYMGAVRQDSVNKKVYYIDSTITSDALLYNFNLRIGDTMPPLLYNRYLTNPIVVTKLDSILINNNYHKVFHFNGMNFNSSWDLIEGVGWSGDFFGILVSSDGSVNLACFDGQMIMPGFDNECVVAI
ncbi:MAG: hypothetical protein HY840_06110 [Bacteroidetes bacterium]|nr:hypothetical protein [Bacteroidota bacterium]